MVRSRLFPVRLVGVVVTLLSIAAGAVIVRGTDAGAQSSASPWPVDGCVYAEPVYPDHGFTDIEAGSFYETAVAWAKASAITKGTGGARFAPADGVTRAQMAAFLWRMVCSPTGAADARFADVADGLYFSEAVDWLTEQGVTEGTGPGTYSPNDIVTRAQMAAFLWRMPASRPVRLSQASRTCRPASSTPRA